MITRSRPKTLCNFWIFSLAVLVNLDEGFKAIDIDLISREAVRSFSFIQGERYRYSPISPLYVYGRPQDIGWQKARGTIHERNHMRFWFSGIVRRLWKGLIFLTGNGSPTIDKRIRSGNTFQPI